MSKTSPNLHKDNHTYFKWWCEVSGRYAFIALFRNQSLNQTMQKFD